MEAIQVLNRKITEITGIPQENFAYPQVLRYKVGQYDLRHEDYIAQHDRPSAPRVYTTYIYLSEVEKGGETVFPSLNLKVKPKTGRTIIWPLVNSSDPFQKDKRTEHDALPVKKGLKYGINTWIHMQKMRGVANSFAG